MLRLAVALAAIAVAPSATADSCAADDVLYMALEPMQELLGVRGETRQQYLDRVYSGWQEDKEQIVRSVTATDNEATRISLTASTGIALERVDIIVESKFDYVDRGDRRKQRVGHREIARYPLATDATSEISVPKSVFREPGSLLVVVTARRTDAGAPDAVVGVLPVELRFCPRRVYTHDRSTAIRLNRTKEKSPPAK